MMAILPYIFTIALSIWAIQCATIPTNVVHTKSLSSCFDLRWKRTTEPGITRRRKVAGRISEDSGFWFAHFTVGAASNLSLLIDTGSSDVILNSGLYKPRKSSKKLNMSFTNFYGTTSSNGTGNGMVQGSLYTDTVRFGSLAVKQTVGSANGSLLPGDGIVGLSGQLFSQFPTNSTPLLHSLCNQGQINECRFGLALRDNNSGILVFGEQDTTLYSGDLTVTPILDEWVLSGDLAINGSVVARDLVIELDSGTATIVGPIDAVSSIFSATGIQSVLQSGPEGDVLLGYFPCHQPPSVGFRFPSHRDVSSAAQNKTSRVSHEGVTFDIPSGAWAASDNGHNNCTAVLSGQDAASFPGLWVVGQPFFQGLYIDHNLASRTVGFAHLRSEAKSNNTIYLH